MRLPCALACIFRLRNNGVRVCVLVPHHIQDHTTLPAVPCFPTYLFSPEVETFFIPGKLFVVQTFCLLYLILAITPHGGCLGPRLGVSPSLLKSKLLSGGPRGRAWAFLTSLLGHHLGRRVVVYLVSMRLSWRCQWRFLEPCSIALSALHARTVPLYMRFLYVRPSRDVPVFFDEGPHLPLQHTRGKWLDSCRHGPC